MSDDKVRKAAAIEMRTLARDGGVVKLIPTTVLRWADLIDPPAPPPEPAKPMRWWVVDAVLAGYPSRRPYELFYQTVKPAGDYIEVCIHPADAPHCDKAEHEQIATRLTVNAKMVEAMERRVSELEALLREGEDGHKDCDHYWCVRVRAALEPAAPKKVGPCYRLEDGTEVQCRTCGGGA